MKAGSIGLKQAHASFAARDEHGVAPQALSNRLAGLTDRQIKQGLRAAGWKAPVKKKKRAIPLFGTIGSPGGLQTYQG